MTKDAKYIHYCWFGDKKLSKLAKKCIKSWKKYLPDYKIICWNEENTDINECPFIKEAYEKKKWAFVADYARVKALYEYGGIYFDTDMLIKKDIKFLLEKTTFLGVEDSKLVAAGVWREKNPKSFLTKQILDFYRSQEHFNDEDDIYQITIPRILTQELMRLGYKDTKCEEIQELKKDICVYPREYFYPLSYDYKNNKFSDKTCMIHYFDASWVSENEKRNVKLIRIFGRKKTDFLLKLFSKIKKLFVFYLLVLKRTCIIIIYPIKYFARRRKYLKENEICFLRIAEKIRNTNKRYIVFCRKDWLGIKSATTSMFGEVIEIEDISDIDNFKIITDAIVKQDIKLVVFSALSVGWEYLAQKIKEADPSIIIKIIWHGSNANNLADYDMERFACVFDLLNKNIINSIAFVKKSMYLQYKQLGYNVEFLANTYTFKGEVNKKRIEKGSPIHIGLYGSGYDRWTKNFYNQLAAISILKKDKVVDIIPLTEKIKNYTKILKVDANGSSRIIPHDRMIERIRTNDIVLYVTFVECAPMLPLECLEQKVICITGPNHHYWENTELEKFLVEPKCDNPMAIAERIELCLTNREKILRLYEEWKETYDKECQELIKEFLNYNKITNKTYKS